MTLWEIFGTALALAMDAFAVAGGIAAGLQPLTRRQVFRLSWHFGFFQGAMPVLGWLGGSAVSAFAAAIAHWIAGGLLAAIGLRMIAGSLHADALEGGYDPTRGLSLVGLSVATSIDALAVGISMGLIGASIWLPAGVIGGVTILWTCAGMFMGRRLGHLLGPWAERGGGCLLILLGIRFVLT